MMKKILAVSGGIDSMVLLDLFKNDPAVVVAHFDHGTRESSATDAEFVRQKAAALGLPFFTACGHLGENISEELARKARYDFLYQLAQDLPGTIYTAHHLNDLAESIAINLIRGTGWRGLAALDSAQIRRPFLEPSMRMDKKQIRIYAAEHHLIYREDPTNNSDHYLRNRVRPKLQSFTSAEQLYQLWQQQQALKQQLDQTIAELLPPVGQPWQRSWFTNLDTNIALELLRAGLSHIGVSATRPQLENFRQAIINYSPGKYFNLPNNYLVKLNKTNFTL